MNNPENLSSEGNGLDIRRLFDTLIRRWWVIAITTVFIAVVAYVISSLQPVEYQAKATLLIQPAQSSSGNEYNVMLVASKLALTYTEMLKGESVVEEVITRLNLDQTSKELADKIVIETIPDTQLIQLTVSDTSSKRAADIANTLADVFLKHTKALQAERYSSPLKAIQVKIEDLANQTEETKTKIESLNKQKVDNDIEISRLQDELKDRQDNLRILQQNYQDIQLIIARTSNVVQITDKARVTNSSLVPVTATVMLQINQLPSTNKESTNTTLLSDSLAPTYEFMLQSPTLLDEAIKRSEVVIEPAELASRIKVEQVPGTQMIKLSVWGSTAETAMKITDAVAQALAVQTQAIQAKPYLDEQVALKKQMEDLTAQIEQTRASIIETTTAKVLIEQDLSQYESTLTEFRENNRALLQDHDQLLLAEASSVDAVLISEPAKEQKKPINSRIVNTILAMMVGGMVGIGMAFLIEYTEDKVRTRQDIHKTLGVYPITTISRMPSDRSNKVLDEWSPGTRIAEEFRALGTKIRLDSTDSVLRTVCVTSPAQSEGKTFVLANLAISLARMGLKVIAIDADLRHPQLHIAFGINQEKGLSDFLANNEKNGSSANSIKLTDVKGVQILSSGKTPEDPIGLLSLPKFKNLLEEMSKKADLVLVDCPPVLPVADASVLASNVDGVLLIVRADQTNNRAAKDAVENLAKVNARFVGVVLNAVVISKDQYSRYYSRSRKIPPFAFRQIQNVIASIQKKLFQINRTND